MDHEFVDNFLEHYGTELAPDGDYLQHWKYIKRERVNGKWKYYYDLDSLKKNVSTAVSNVKKNATNTVNTAKKNISKTVNTAKKNISKTTQELAKKGSEFVKKFEKKSVADMLREVQKEKKEPKKPTTIAEMKEAAAADAEKNVAKAKEGAYQTSQNKERGLKREAELKERLDNLGKKVKMFEGTSYEFEYELSKKLPGLNLKTSATTLDEDQKLINPNYSPDSKYDENCAFCSIAYDLRRRGYDVVAKPEITKYGNSGTTNLSNVDMAKLYNTEPTSVSYLADKHGYSNDFVGQSKATEAEILSYGEGATGFLNVSWSSGGGHSVAWEVENGKVVVRDCQTNKKHEIVNLVIRSNYADIVRTDNAQPSDEVLQYVENRKR